MINKIKEIEKKAISIVDDLNNARRKCKEFDELEFIIDDIEEIIKEVEDKIDTKISILLE